MNVTDHGAQLLDKPVLQAFGIGPTELIIILFIVLIIFGGTRLPQVGDALGRGIRNFKRAVTGSSESKSDNKNNDQQKPVHQGQPPEA